MLFLFKKEKTRQQPRSFLTSINAQTAHFTFEIKNLKLDANGKASYSVAIEIRDASGKIFYEQRPYNAGFRRGAACRALFGLPLRCDGGGLRCELHP